MEEFEGRAGQSPAFAGSCVEVDFEYEPGHQSSLTVSESEGRAFGVLLELAAYAASLAFPGCTIRDIRFGAPIRLDPRRSYRGRADPSTHRVDVSSAVRAAVGDTPTAVHLEAAVQAAVSLEASDRPNSEAHTWAMGVLRADDWSTAFSATAAAAVFGTVTSYENGLAVALDLGSEDCSQYQVHPLVADCWWLLASRWCRSRGRPDALAPVFAQSFQILKPGARVDSIRLVHLPPTNAETDRLLLVAEEAGQVASLLYDLRVAVTASVPQPYERTGAQTESHPRSAEPLRSRVERLALSALGRPLVGNDLVESGATSLDLIAILNALQRDLGVDLPTQEIFKEPSIAHLVRMCEAALAGVSDDQGAIQDEHPGRLSPTQQDIWTTTQSIDVGAAYNECVAIELLGSVDLPALEHSLEQLLRRHPALRSRLRDSGATVEMQTLAPQLDYQLLDLSGDRPDEDFDQTRRHAREYAKEFARRPFDPGEGYGFRAALIRESREAWVLVLCAHHVFVDGWSLSQVLIPDLCATYSRYRAEGVRIASHAVVEQAAEPTRHAKPAFDPLDLAWWQAATAHIPSVPALLGKRFTDKPTFDAEYEYLLVPQQLVTAVDVLARRLSTTRFCVLLAVFAASLRKLSRDERFCIGVPAANRRTSAEARAVDCLVNMLPIPVHPDAQLAFEDLIGDVTRTVRDALARQDVPFSIIARAVTAERRAGTMPLLAAVLAMQPPLAWDEAATGLVATERDVEVGSAKTDLAVVVREQEECLVCRFEYRSAMFSRDWVRQLSTTWLRTLDQVVLRPEQALDSIELSTEGDRDRVAAWNSTTLPFNDAGTLYDRFREWAVRAPDAPAIITAEGVTSYGQLDSMACRIAEWLLERRVGEQPIGVHMHRSELAVAAALAIWKAGSTYVPIDVSYPAARQRVILEDAAVSVVVAEADVAAALNGFQREASAGSEQHTAAGVERRPAYIVFTSGSSGRPKGVIGHHRGLLNLSAVQAATFLVNPGDVVLQFAALGFDAALWEICMALTNGASLAIPDQRTNRSPRLLAEFIRQSGVTIGTMPPAMWALLDGDLGRLRCAISAGEACSEAIVRKLERQCDVYNAYGPTEAGICATLVRCNDIEGSPPIGRPIANVRIHVTDEQMRAVPVGWPGEICIAGVGVALGYVGETEISVSRFITSTHLPEPGGVYRTGDIGRWRSDGLLEFIGRNDRQVKVRGHRIELGEIENTLRRHPAVALCSARYEQREGEGAVVASVQCVRPVSEGDLKRFLRGFLPPYAIPARVAVLTEMPTNEHGKSRVSAVPEGEERGSANSELVAYLVHLWSEILGRMDIGEDTSFFDAGGDSLAAIRLVDRAQERALRVSVDDLYTYLTPAAVALRIEEERGRDDAIDLVAETALDLQIEERERRTARADLKSVFVTGATGFLGGFLVRELLERSDIEIICLVRAASDSIGRERIRNNMIRFGIWKEEYAERVAVVCGDLGKRALGISPRAAEDVTERVQAIVHCGARVDLAAPYRALRNENVQGTLEITRMAAIGAGTALHFVSTLAVTTASENELRDEVTAGDPLTAWSKLIGGYTCTKWVAERLVQRAWSRGLELQIYRPGLLIADTSAGRGPVGDVFGRFVRACVQVRAVPRELALRYLGPVDRVAAVIAAGVLAQRLNAPPLHLADPRALGAEALATAIRRVGGHVELTSYQTWYGLVRGGGRGSPLHPILHLFPIDSPPDASWPSVRCAMDADERPIVEAPNWDSLDALLHRLVRTELRGGAPENR